VGAPIASLKVTIGAMLNTEYGSGLNWLSGRGYPTEIGPKLAQSFIGALELMGVGIALVLDQRDLAVKRPLN
jgi:hypothetical protein